MRVAVIVLTMVVATPSGASQSCMSKTEARQYFGSTYIYWHGPDHCWDATPTRHHQIQVRRKTLVHQVRQKIDQPQWREADVRDVASRPTYSDASDANVRGCSLRWRRLAVMMMIMGPRLKNCLGQKLYCLRLGEFERVRTASEGPDIDSIFAGDSGARGGGVSFRTCHDSGPGRG